MTSLVFEMPRFQGILRWITQLPNGRPDALTQLQIKPNRSHAVFVRVHESMVAPVFATLIFDVVVGLLESIRRRCGESSPRHDESRAR